MLEMNPHHLTQNDFKPDLLDYNNPLSCISFLVPSSQSSGAGVFGKRELRLNWGLGVEKMQLESLICLGAGQYLVYIVYWYYHTITFCCRSCHLLANADSFKRTV